MGRLSKLTPAQWTEVGRRLNEGESAANLAKEFGISPTQISLRITKQSKVIWETAQKMADAQTAIAALPVAQQHQAMSLADRLRNISSSYASAAELGAKTAHRLHALANAEVAKVDDANLMSDESMTALKGVGVLTKLGNDALVPASNLLAANKETLARASDDKAEGDPTSGVLVVPGVIADPSAWSKRVRGEK